MAEHVSIQSLLFTRIQITGFAENLVIKTPFLLILLSRHRQQIFQSYRSEKEQPVLYLDQMFQTLVQMYNDDPEAIYAVIAMILASVFLQANVYVTLRMLKGMQFTTSKGENISEGILTKLDSSKLI